MIEDNRNKLVVDLSFTIPPSRSLIRTMDKREVLTLSRRQRSGPVRPGLFLPTGYWTLRDDFVELRRRQTKLGF
jgi:hypothetical protein